MIIPPSFILDHPPSPRALELMAWLSEYSASRLNLSLTDERRSLPPQVFFDFGRKGLLGINGEPKFGGLDLSSSDCFFVAQQFGAIDLSLSISVLLQSFLVTQPLRVTLRNPSEKNFCPIW